MKLYFGKKRITAILFCVCLFMLPVLSIPTLLPKLKDFVKDKDTTSIQSSFSSIDGILNENMYERNSFIEGYGYLQNVIGKKEINNLEIIKGDKDILYYQEYRQGPVDVSELTKRVQRLAAYEKEKGTETIVLLTPDKYIRGKSKLVKGAPYNYANESADAYLSSMRSMNIPTIDLRSEFENNETPIDQLVYKSDHHWRIETAFQAFQTLVDELNKQGYDLDEERIARSEEHYNSIVYKQSFLGSQGRASSVAYSGLDDFTYIYPKFTTDFTYEWNYDGTSFKKTGRFEQVLTNPKYLQAPAGYEPINDKYTAYLDGNAGIAKIHNNLINNNMKVLFIKDSYSLPLVAFFANVCEDIELIDPRYYDGDVEAYIKDNNYTHVFVSMSAQSMDVSFFPFFESDDVE